MGCHTWAYKKLKDSDLLEVKSTMEKLLKKSIFYAKSEKAMERKMNRFYVLCKEMYKDYKDMGDLDGVEYFKRLADRKTSAKYYMKQNEKLQSLLADLNSCQDIKSLSGFYKKREDVLSSTFLTDFRVHRGNLYGFVYFDYPIRVYGYPEETFTKEDKFVKWLEETGQEITAEDRKNISDFWKEFDGNVLVKFG